MIENKEFLSKNNENAKSKKTQKHQKIYYFTLPVKKCMIRIIFYLKKKPMNLSKIYHFRRFKMNIKLKRTLLITLLSGIMISCSHAAENGDSWLDRSKKAAEKALDKSTEMVDKFIKKGEDEEGESTENDAENQENGDKKGNALFGDVWSKITPELDKALTLQDQQDSLPDSSWFGKDKGDTRDELNAGNEIEINW